MKLRTPVLIGTSIASICFASPLCISQTRTLQYTMETANASQPSANPTQTTKVSLVYPDKAWVETDTANKRITIVSDGASTWAYDAQKNVFGKTAGVFGASGDASQLEFLPNGASDVLVLASPAPPELSKPGGEETISIDGKERRCSATVVTLSKTGTVITFCTDDETGLTVQLTTETTRTGEGNTPKRTKFITKMTSLALNESVADPVFSFIFPPGVKQATFDTIVPVQRGLPIPRTFDLKGLDGVSYNSASLKGKRVLLVFWTTWCRPCRDAAAAVNLISRDTKNDDLVILGVDPAEPASTVEAFLKTSLVLYPVVAGADSGIIRQFHISGYPTYVVLNGDGLVSAQEFGYPGETNLRNLLVATGPKQFAPLPAGAVPPGGGVSPPTVISRVQPQYTDKARNAKLQGTVVVSAVVLEDGSLQVISVVRGLGMGLDENAVNAMKQWKFRPGMKDGKPVKTILNIEVNFNLAASPTGR